MTKLLKEMTINEIVTAWNGFFESDYKSVPLQIATDIYKYENDAKHVKGCDDSVKLRNLVERTIVRQLCKELMDGGALALRLHDGEVWATSKTPNVEEIMEELQGADEERLYVYYPDSNSAIFLVYGNGVDVISDYHIHNSVDLAMEKLSPVEEFLEQILSCQK